jgi:MHS family proline/betaine transporter-like MFS transporter
MHEPKELQVRQAVGAAVIGEQTGSPIAPTYYLIAAAIVSTAVIFSLRETAHEPLR